MVANNNSVKGIMTKIKIKYIVDMMIVARYL